MKRIIVTHLLGTILAAIAGWFLPTLIYSGEYLLPAQLTSVTLISLWAIKQLAQMVRGKDELANRTAKYFDAKR